MFRGLTGVFRGCGREGMFRGSDRDLLLPMAAIRERSPTAHFSQQLEKWAKEPEETKGFFTSFRAMTTADLMLRSARLRKSFCVAPSKDCLSNSVAAADWFAEQRFWFYRRTA